jgi:hypothetical protein
MKNISMSTFLLAYANSWTMVVIGMVLGFLFTTFLLDGFKVSKFFIIRVLQLVFFFLIISTILYIVIFQYFSTSAVIYCESTGDEAKALANVVSTSTPSISGNVTTTGNINLSMSTENARILGKAVVDSSINLGLGASIAAGVTAASSMVSKTNLPIAGGGQLGVLAGGALIGGGAHVLASGINRLPNSTVESTTASTSSATTASTSSATTASTNSVFYSDVAQSGIGSLSFPDI